MNEVSETSVPEVFDDENAARAKKNIERLFQHRSQEAT